VRDRRNGTTERVSVATGGTQASGGGGLSSISAGGRYVAFMSPASDLVAGDTNGFWDVFVHDRQTGTTERVSVESGGTQANNNSSNPPVSADGRYVVFWSWAPTLVGADNNGAVDVFVRDRLNGTTELASVDPGGAPGNGYSGIYGVSISADARYVAFDSSA